MAILRNLYFVAIVCFAFVNMGRIGSGTTVSTFDLERAIAQQYGDKGRVSEKTVDTGQPFGRVHFRSSGPQDGMVVLFCHGAAFSSSTWQITGVLDLLGSRGFYAIAIDLPGYRESPSSAKISDALKAHFIDTFLQFVQRPEDRMISSRVIVVSASMGGTFAFSFIQKENSPRVAGYVSIAGLFPTKISTEAFITDIPLLLIFGENDPLFNGLTSTYKRLFSRYEMNVIENAPHPCYLRDANAAAETSNLIADFCERMRSQIRVLPRPVEKTAFRGGEIARGDGGYFFVFFTLVIVAVVLFVAVSSTRALDREERVE